MFLIGLNINIRGVPCGKYKFNNPLSSYVEIMIFSYYVEIYITFHIMLKQYHIITSRINLTMRIKN